MSTVLVIDSAETFARYIDLVLGRYGCRTTGVKSAGAALEVLSAQPVDLVISQEKLPDMEWSRFCELAKKMSRNLEVPVIVLASDPRGSVPEVCDGILVAEVRTRPISMGELISVLSEHIPLHNKRRTLRASVTMRALIREKGDLVPCQVLNLSEGGVFVLRNNPGEVGDPVELVLPLPGVEAPVRVSGTVVYVVRKSTGKKPRGIGVQFSELAPETTDLLHAHLEEQVSSILGR